MTVPIIASFLNFILFFFTALSGSRYNPKEVKRRREFQKAMAQSRVNPSTGSAAKHKCAICGRTELDDPILNSGSVPNAMETMNTARIICLLISM